MNALSQWPVAVAPAVFTSLVPALLRYQRGALARLGEILAIILSVALALCVFSPTINTAYARIEPSVYAAFFVCALAGIALCTVGIHDRKRSAWWALMAILSLGVGVSVGRVVPGAIGCGVFFAIAWALRARDTNENSDVVSSIEITANNRTRRARSIPRKLLREGQLHFLPLYYLATLSDLAREGIRNSGSYRFADHIYRMQPSGRGALGRWIDQRFLALPATQAFHLRYKRAQTAMRSALESFPASETPLRILAIPCGLPRDLTELAATLARENPALLARIEYHGMDIDPELLTLAENFTEGCGVPHRVFHRGNALCADDFPRVGFHAIVSTGLGEFLNDTELEIFYRHVHGSLLPGGMFYTSATRYEKRSEAFLRAFDLITQYRTTAEIERILTRLPWSRLTLTQDETGLQTFVTAVK